MEAKQALTPTPLRRLSVHYISVNVLDKIFDMNIIFDEKYFSA
jgi:hypothetical protein